MNIYVLGNPLVKDDSLPLKLIPFLRKGFPEYNVLEIDPNEDFIPEENSVIIDTVVGIDKITLFTDIDQFTGHKLISPHDYDLGFHLKFLKKMGKIKNLKIMGVPQSFNTNQAYKEIAKSMRGF